VKANERHSTGPIPSDVRFLGRGGVRIYIFRPLCLEMAECLVHIPVCITIDSVRAPWQDSAAPLFTGEEQIATVLLAPEPQVPKVLKQPEGDIPNLGIPRRMMILDLMHIRPGCSVIRRLIRPGAPYALFIAK